MKSVCNHIISGGKFDLRLGKMSENGDENIQHLENEIRQLKYLIEMKEKELSQLRGENRNFCKYSSGLATNEVTRYSRQMLLPQIGLKGQMKLKNSSVLIVGIGGLGSPSALYLAAAGIGKLTLVDYDEVELSNLHRQILHSTSNLGEKKVESASKHIKDLNGEIEVTPIHMAATSETLEKLFSSTSEKFDVVIDGSDNVATRYLLNDICVLNEIPLVSGSALKMEGQLTVYNYKNGPCYRCLFPVPPPPSSVTNCGDGGVLGPVVGTIGVLQALETIKILCNFDGVLNGRLLIFDGNSTSFTNVKLRNRQESCEICGAEPKIKALIDYEQFCSSKAHDKVVDIDLNGVVTHKNARELTERSQRTLVVDVRPEIEFEMCTLPETTNLSYDFIANPKKVDQVIRIFENFLEKYDEVWFVCRRGNDSQRTIEYLQKIMGKNAKFFNIKGGLNAYSKHVDPAFPVY